jgi:hypothetical protein
MATNTGVTINGQFVKWSFIQMVRKCCGGDWDMALDCFYKARNADNVTAYIASGFRPDIKGVRHMLLPSATRELGERGMESIRQWWDTCIYQRKPAAKSIKDIFAGIAAGTEV